MWPSICTIFIRLSLLLADKSVHLVHDDVERIAKTGLGWENLEVITRPFRVLESLKN